MERTEVCAICHATDDETPLVGWYIGPERRPVHFECWLRDHLREPIAAPAAGTVER